MNWLPPENAPQRARIHHKSRRNQRSSLGALTLAGGFLLASLMLQGPAIAQNVHPAHPEDGRQVVYLSFEEALKRGAQSGPDVIYAKAPSASTKEALRYSNPLFTQVPVMQVQAGPRFSSTNTSPDLTVSLSQPIPLTNTGRAQERLARAEVNFVEKDVELAVLDSAERAGQAWIELAYAEELLKLRHDALEQAKKHLQIVESRMELGAIDQSDLALARGEVASARALVLDAEGQHFLAASELAYVTGLSETQRADVKTLLSDVPIFESTRDGSAGAVHPALASAEARAEASKQGIDYAKSQQVPTMSFGLQYQREGTGDQIVTGIFTVPLALWKPWRFQEAQARIKYDQARAQTKRVELELNREIERALHEREHATAKYKLLKSSAIPPREQSLRIALAKFEAGEVDFLQVSWAKRELLSEQERLVTALAELHRAHLHLLRSTGALKENRK